MKSKLWFKDESYNSGNPDNRTAASSGSSVQIAGMHINFSSAEKGKDQRSRQGNRVLNAIFHFLAIQLVQVNPNGSKKARTESELACMETQIDKDIELYIIRAKQFSVAT